MRSRNVGHAVPEMSGNRSRWCVGRSWSIDGARHIVDGSGGLNQFERSFARTRSKAVDKLRGGSGGSSNGGSVAIGTRHFGNGLCLVLCRSGKVGGFGHSLDMVMDRRAVRSRSAVRCALPDLRRQAQEAAL